MAIVWFWQGPGYYEEVTSPEGKRYRFQVNSAFGIENAEYVEDPPMETHGKVGIFVEEEEEKA